MGLHRLSDGLSVKGFVANASFGVSGSTPWHPHYGVESNLSSIFVFEDNGSVVFSDPVNHVPWNPNTRVDVVLADTQCSMQTSLIAALVSDFNSQLSRSDGDTIQWTFL